MGVHDPLGRRQVIWLRSGVWPPSLRNPIACRRLRGQRGRKKYQCKVCTPLMLVRCTTVADAYSSYAGTFYYRWRHIYSSYAGAFFAIFVKLRPERECHTVCSIYSGTHLCVLPMQACSPASSCIRRLVAGRAEFEAKDEGRGDGLLGSDGSILSTVGMRSSLQTP